jgi:uncharacterized protein
VSKMIKNITKNTIICKNKKFLTTIISKAIGLMFSKKIKDIGYIFVFDKSQRIDLHMFFVFFAIDVIFLNELKEVIEIKKNFKPFTLYSSKKPIKYFIELPLKLSDKIKIGDILEF